MKKLLVGILLFLAVAMSPTKAAAEEYLLYGLGLANSARDSAAETKFIGLGWRGKFPAGLVQQLEVGHFTDSMTSSGRKSSLWLGYSLGVEVQNDPLVLRLMVGPSYLSTPDVYLGGHFQFNNDACGGVRDKQGRSIMVCYKHLSSAGIETPNVGRDGLLFEVAVPW